TMGLLTVAGANLSGIAVSPACADDALVAVAANFVLPFREVATEFEKASGHHITIATGSSGNFYAQMKNGAPYDVFFSADDERPKRLADEGLGIASSRFTYAVGRLALWSPDAAFITGEETLKHAAFKHLAIANPKTAPYGTAAMQTLQKLGLWDAVRLRLVMGENQGQTMGFIESGSAELGFVALSQIMQRALKIRGSHWIVPADFHAPIRQDAILLVKGKDNRAALALMEFIKGPRARAMIIRYGYELNGEGRIP
ncbi:MAG: molybdate ABC transporter substrate-binding protein, partial [Nitrospira sp.]|nr:molybdate ABC transporter substrate-binding protein [Nitrospira sp.]